MNNQIANSKVEVPSGIALNDKDYMNCTLSTLKEMEKNLTVSLTECSCEELYQQYFNMFSSIAKLQREAYELMFRKGWYTLEKAEANKINQKLEMLSQEFNGLS